MKAKAILFQWILMTMCVRLSATESATEPQKIKVHLLAHSHIDPGWRKTFSEYFYKDNYEVDKGHRDFIGGARAIYRSMIEELLIDKQKKYVLSEMCYFELWYRHCSLHMKEIVKQLIREKRIEIGGGGYVAPDDATPYYDDLIDMTMMGHEWLRKTFGIRPTTQWEMDTFGQSAGHVQLSYDMGLMFLVACRLDYYDKHYRTQDKRMQFIFAPQQTNRDTPVFTYITHAYYSYPIGYWYDANINPNGNTVRDIEHDIMNIGTNIEERAEELVGYLRNAQERIGSKAILQMIGNDFALQSNGETFENYDRLFDHINAKKKKYRMDVDYILPTEYLDRYIVADDNNSTYTVKRSDFFPFRNSKIGFWSGFYSSKQNSKYVSRWSSIYLNQVRSIVAAVVLNAKEFQQINKQKVWMIENMKEMLEKVYDLEQAIALFQHHDAITGTCYNTVTNDYLSMQFKAQRKVQKVLDSHLNQVVNNQFMENKDNVYINCQNNDTVHLACPFVEQEQINNQAVLVSIYNQFNHQSRQLLKIKVHSRHSYLIGSDNKKLDYQEVFCINPFDENDCDLMFIADLGPISFSFYKLLIDRSAGHHISRFDFNWQSDKEHHVIQTTQYTFLMISKDMKEYKYYYCGTGKLDQQKCDQIQFKISYGTYSSYQQHTDGKDGGSNSGHYVLHVTKDYHFDEYHIEKISVYKGSLITKVYIYANDGKVQAIMSFYNTEIVAKTENVVDWKQVDLETIIEPLDVQQRGKEFIFRIVPSMYGKEFRQRQFYTDRNGLDLQERIIDQREDYNLGNEHDRVAQNMYPVTSCIYVRIHDGNFVMIVDRAMAGGVIDHKQVELLMQREHVTNDGMGISEPLVERDSSSNKVKIRNSINLLFIRYSNEVQYHRKLQQQRDSRPLVLFTKTAQNQFISQADSVDIHLEMAKKNRMIKTQANGYVKVNYLPRKDGSMYVRLTNLNENHEAELEIHNKYVQELSIQGSWKIEELNKLHEKYDFRKLKLVKDVEWKSDEQIHKNQELVKEGKIKLIPMQIRTFLIGDDESELQKYESEEEQCQDYIKIYSKE